MAAGLASAALVAACGGDGDGADDEQAETAGTEADAAILAVLLDLEFASEAAYAAAAPLLRGRARDAARTIASHERRHAEVLAAAIRAIGVTPPGRRAASEYAADRPRIAGSDATLRFALDLEDTAVAAYLDALPKLTTPRLRQTAAAILVSEAEHASLVLEALGEPPLQGAFVTGAGA